RFRITCLFLGTLAGLVLVVPLPTNLGELSAQGADFGVCLLDGVLCLLGELHGRGTSTLGLPPRRFRITCLFLGTLAGLVLVVPLPTNLGELSAQGHRVFGGGGGSLVGTVGLDLRRLGGGLGPLCLGTCLHGVSACRCRFLLCRLDGGTGVQCEPYTVAG
ncbi:hypothetical protein ACIOEX_02555, partial [Streptomyces sp. NPDC087850]|uniref:hypothetical protein n=1 Tax=Streptomyces sp. NPDC087850 TaxID=3365809 RepID=UPI003816CA9B